MSRRNFQLRGIRHRRHHHHDAVLRDVVVRIDRASLTDEWQMHRRDAAAVRAVTSVE